MASGPELTIVFEAIERAFQARTPAELDAIMAEAFALYGVSNFGVDQFRDATGALVGIHHFGRRDESWGEHYIREQHYLHDCVIRHAIFSPAPARWLQFSAAPDLTPAEARLFGEAREFGVKDGFVTPVHQIDGNLSAVTLTAPEKLELSPEDQAGLRLLSLYYCSFGLLLKQRGASADAPAPVLTRRQREILQWVRAGKSSWDIGKLLGISEATVNFHVAEAMRRLNVKTRPQAVMEAIVRGLISL
jgi:LuxR family quorum sensing-dependent transcriptional regulator